MKFQAALSGRELPDLPESEANGVQRLAFFKHLKARQEKRKNG